MILTEKIKLEYAERLSTVDKIIEMYPQLKKDKKIIVQKVLENTNQIKQKNNILERIIINDKKYYKDEEDNIFNDKNKLAGFIINEKTHLFDDRLVFNTFG